MVCNMVQEAAEYMAKGAGGNKKKEKNVDWKLAENRKNLKVDNR